MLFLWKIYQITDSVEPHEEIRRRTAWRTAERHEEPQSCIKNRRTAWRTVPQAERLRWQVVPFYSWYRVRALVRKCVRRSVCQRAVSARRALTGLSANHVRVKQYHVCPSANFCCVSAGKGSLPWSAFYNASRYIYFTPSQCPLAFKCFCFFPRILSNYVFNGLVYGSFNPYIPIASNYSCSVSILLSANQQNIVAVRFFFHPWLPYRFLPSASNYSSFRSHSILHCSTHLLSFCQLAPPPSYNCCSWSLSKCSVLSSSIAFTMVPLTTPCNSAVCFSLLILRIITKTVRLQLLSQWPGTKRECLSSNKPYSGTVGRLRDRYGNRTFK